MAVVTALLACPDCDLLQQARPTNGVGTMRCARCRTHLRTSNAASHDLRLALALAGLVLLALGHAFPLAFLSVQGQATATTLPGAIAALWNADMSFLASLVALTASVAPTVELLALALVLGHMRSGRMQARYAPLLRLLRAIEGWNMTEVFVLAALVALAKLDDYADVHYGIALFSLGGAMFLVLAASSGFDRVDAWDRSMP